MFESSDALPGQRVKRSLEVASGRNSRERFAIERTIVRTLMTGSLKEAQTATLSVSSARISECTVVREKDARLSKFDDDEFYYEDLACEEEIYLEGTKEELRSELILNTPQDNGTQPDDSSGAREAQQSLFQE
jgi:hypothetical protein